VVTPTSLLPLVVTPTATATPTVAPPLARMGEGLLRTTSPTGHTWRDLDGKQ
jgi:hypothetical protein